MNHKRSGGKSGNKAMVRRQEHKSFRQAERRAVRGDRPGSPFRQNWSSPPRADELPVVERPGKRRSKAKRIQYCPAREGNKRHHYLEDEETVRYWSPGYSTWYRAGWHTYTSRYKLCVYCGDVKSVGRRRYRR